MVSVATTLKRQPDDRLTELASELRTVLLTPRADTNPSEQDMDKALEFLDVLAATGGNAQDFLSRVAKLWMHAASLVLSREQMDSLTLEIVGLEQDD